jgi:integrase
MLANCGSVNPSHCRSRFCRVPESWLREEFLAAIPAEDLRLRPIPRHTIPPYELLEELPIHVEQEIASVEKKLAAGAVENREWKRVRLALLWRHKLIFLFLLHLSWRMGNIAQLRWGTGRDLLLYRAPRCQFSHGLLYQERPGHWRFFFPSSATKNGRVVQGDLPATIVPTLERYLKDHWPRLRARDRSFLFPNSEGRLSETTAWCNIIKRETFRYLRVAVNPHRFRHSFAFYYLAQRPEDYLTLSRYLWHRSVEVTIRTYGGFEPEDALRHIEAWRAERGEEQSESRDTMGTSLARGRTGGPSHWGTLTSLRKHRV